MLGAGTKTLWGLQVTLRQSRDTMAYWKSSGGGGYGGGGGGSGSQGDGYGSYGSNNSGGWNTGKKARKDGSNYSDDTEENRSSPYGGGGNKRGGGGNNSTTEQIVGTLGSLVRERLKEKERKDSIDAIREMIPFELTGLLGPAAASS